MTGQDGNDELPFFVDDDNRRVLILFTDKRRNRPHGDGRCPDEKEEPCRLKSPARFFPQRRVEGDGRRYGKLRERRLTDLPAILLKEGCCSAAKGRSGFGKGKNNCVHDLSPF